MARQFSAPLIIAGLFAASELVWVIQLGLEPEPFAADSAALLIAGVVVYTVIAVVGILLVRAPWARWLALCVAVATLAIGALGGIADVLAIAAVVMSLVAIGGLAGPWLQIWLRQRPGAGTGATAVALPLVSVGALPLAGLASTEGVTSMALLFALAGPVLAWAYVRSFRWGLWGLRVALPAAALGAAFAADGWAGAAAFVSFGLGVGVLAWSPGAADALSPVRAPLPPPRPQQQPEAGR